MPKTYPEIEAAVKKSIPHGEPFALAIELARLCEAGRLFYRAPGSSFQTEWPAYCVHRFYSRFKSPKRDTAKPGAMA
jgi:hypothetical protein